MPLGWTRCATSRTEPATGRTDAIVPWTPPTSSRTERLCVGRHRPRPGRVRTWLGRRRLLAGQNRFVPDGVERGLDGLASAEYRIVQRRTAVGTTWTGPTMRWTPRGARRSEALIGGRRRLRHGSVALALGRRPSRAGSTALFSSRMELLTHAPPQAAQLAIPRAASLPRSCTTQQETPA